MNDKIENLKKQCYISLVDRTDDMEYDMEKFAELLLVEALEIVYDEIQYELSEEIADEIILKVSKHFGDI